MIDTATSSSGPPMSSSFVTWWITARRPPSGAPTTTTNLAPPLRTGTARSRSGSSMPPPAGRVAHTAPAVASEISAGVRSVRPAVLGVSSTTRPAGVITCA